MATTTFVDIKFNEDVEHRYEKNDYKVKAGDVVSLPYHTGNKFVNRWDTDAEYTDRGTYEVKDIDYDDKLFRVMNSESSETCGVEKSDGEVCGREKPCPYHNDEE